ncbi:unnamed protein product [Leuciscus chuanchicus]
MWTRTEMLRVKRKSDIKRKEVHYPAEKEANGFHKGLLINLLRCSRDAGGLRLSWRPVCMWLMITHIELGAMCKGYWGLTQPKSAGPPQHRQPTAVPTGLALFSQSLGRLEQRGASQEVDPDLCWSEAAERSSALLIPAEQPRSVLLLRGQPPGPRQTTEDSDKRPEAKTQETPPSSAHSPET